MPNAWRTLFTLLENYHRYISLAGTGYCDSKLSENIPFLKGNNSVFFNILENLHQNQSPKVLFKNYCAFPLN